MKELIVLVGLPGSGKSTICKEKYPTFTRINQDEQGKERHKEIFRHALANGRNIIVDRCGFNKEQRQRYIKLAKEKKYKTTIIWLDVPADECINRIMKRPDHPNLHSELSEQKISGIVYMFRDMFVPPSQDEADEVIKL